MARTAQITDHPRRRAARRRCFAVLAAALLTLSGAEAFAQRGRMEPDQRERLRRELRQHGDSARGTGQGARGGDRGDAGDRRRMSAPEREQLRRQLREARPDDARGRARRRD